MGFIFRVGVILRRRHKREKSKNYPHANILTFKIGKERGRWNKFMCGNIYMKSRIFTFLDFDETWLK